MKKNIIILLERLPQRWVMTIMGMLGVMMAYTMRACLSISITQMVLPMKISWQQGQKGVCPIDEMDVSNQTSYVVLPHDNYSDRLAWNEETQGMVLSAFYYGYIVMHIPGGIMAQRFGGKFIVAYTILSTSVLTLLTPTMARLGPTHLMALRFIQGLGEGMMFPALCSILAQWAPPKEKTKLSTIVFAGVPIGNIIANLFSGLIINYVPGGWPNVFYIFGSIALLWLVIWIAIVYNNPLSHPFISDQEHKYLRDAIGCVERNKDLAPTPWKAIFSSRQIWALIIAEIGFDWGAYTIVNDLPKYMNDVLHFSVKQNGVSSSTPYLAQWIVSFLASLLAEFLISKQIMTVSIIRKLYAIVGLVGPALGVMGASFVECDKVMATLYFTIAMAAMGFCYPSIRVNALDLSPNYSASIMAVVNGLGCLSGMATPYVVGLLTLNRTIYEWRKVFWIMMSVLVSSSLIFSIFGSGEQQPWNDRELNYGNKKKCKKESKQECKIFIHNADKK